MKYRVLIRRALQTTALLAAVSLGQAARADMLVNKNVMVALPSIPAVETLELSTAGLLTVSISDLVFPQALQSLSFAISDGRDILESLTGAGSLSYTTSGPATLFANVYALPDVTAGSGVYHINVMFAPSVVPLPAASWLLLSGLTGLLAWRRSSPRKHATVTNSSVQ